MLELYDTIIVGGGPAGISTAIYLKSRGRKILILEKRKIGGLAESVSNLTHYTGLLGHENGQDFGIRLRETLDAEDIPYKFEEVTSIIREENFKISTNISNYYSKSLVIAAGNERLGLEIDGYENFTRDAVEIKEKTDKIAVVAGGSDGACKEAIYLSDFCKEVHIVEIRDGIFCVNQFKIQIEQIPNIYFHKSSEIINAIGNSINKIEIMNNKSNEKTTIEGDIVAFSYIGQRPKLEFLNNLLPLKDGYIDSGIKTEIDGIFVAGDCRVKSIRQIATAVADGAVAANVVDEYLSK